MNRRTPLIRSGAAVAALLVLPTVSVHAQLGDILKRHKKDDNKDKGSTIQPVDVKLTPYHGPKKRLAVADMEIKIQANVTSDPTTSGGTSTTTTVTVPPPTDFGTGLTEMLTTSLANTDRFILIERSDKGIADITKEQAQAGVSDATRAQANKLFGAQVIVRGAVTEYSYKKSSTGGSTELLKGIGLARGSSEASVVLDIKLYDASTGEIYDSQKAEGRAKATATAINIDQKNFKFGGSSFQNSPLGAATREAIEKAVKKICDHMDTLPWEGRVAQAVSDEGRGVEIYLNVGSRAGIKVGDEFEVFHPGHDIEDPDNPGRILKRTKGSRVGICRVASVEEDLAIAKPVEGDGFAAKDVIRMVGAVLPAATAPPAADPPKPDAAAKNP